jgi:hypothetical protein
LCGIISASDECDAAEHIFKKKEEASPKVEGSDAENGNGPRGVASSSSIYMMKIEKSMELSI